MGGDREGLWEGGMVWGVEVVVGNGVEVGVDEGGGEE